MGDFTKGAQMEEKNMYTVKKPMTKTEIVTSLAEGTGLTKRQVNGLLNELAGLIGGELGNRGPGVFKLPRLLSARVVHKPATEARKGINPFTKQETVFQAKPARNVVKIVAMKGLKDTVA